MDELHDKNRDTGVVGLKRKLFAALGFTTFALGFVGVFVPLLPTTPFLLVSLYAFSKSFPQFSDKILKNRYLAPYVEGYVSGRGLSTRQKVRTLTLMWAVMLISIIFVANALWLRALLVAIAIGVSVHIINKGRRRN